MSHLQARQDWSLCLSIGVDLGVEEPMILQAVRDPVPRLQSIQSMDATFEAFDFLELLSLQR